MSQDDRFAPPAAEVADLAPGDPRPKPREVRLAVTLLWVSLALSLPILVLGAMRNPAEALHPVSLLVTAALLGVSVLLIRRIDGGRNWARWVYLVLAVIAVALQFAPGEETNGPGYVENALSIIGSLLDVVALWLVFTRPGAGWFRAAA